MLEYEIQFDERPSADVVHLALDFPAGLDFFYQPALTADEIAAGYERPENVIGSYAVYWKESGRWLNGNGEEIADYGTGKFCHIYRPFVVDANGRRAWCEQEISGTDWAIYMPPAFLDDPATVYPVTLGPTFGYTSQGASSYGVTELLWGVRATPASSGTATSVSYWLAAGAGDSQTCGIYADSSGSPGSLLKDSAGGTGSLGLNTQNLDSSLSVTASTYYWIAVQLGTIGGVTLNYDSSGATDRSYDVGAYTAGSLPNPWSGGSNGTVKPSFYSTYTATSSVTPDAVSAAWSVVAPALRAALSPSVVTATWSVVAPSLTMVKSITPDAVSAAWSIQSPTLTASLTPDAVSAQWTIAAPSVVKAVTPDPVSAVWSMPSLGIAQALGVAPVSAAWSVPAVATSTAVMVTPDPVSAAWSVASPSLRRSITPTALPAAWSVVGPGLTLGLGVSPVSAAWSVVAPTAGAVVTGPYFIQESECFSPGFVAGEIFTPGVIEGEIYTPTSAQDEVSA